MLRNVQALRGVAALAVVGAHISDPTGFEPRWLAGDWYWTAGLHEPGQAGVDLFFVISGLIMVVTTHRLAGGDGDGRRFLLRRAIRVYPAYWAATLPVLALFLLSPDAVNGSAENPPRIWESLFLLPQPGLPLLMVGWTLTFEMYFYLVFAVTLLLPRAGRLPALIGWGVVTAALAGLFARSGNPWLSTMSAPISLEFLFGALIGGLVVQRRFVAPGLFAVLGAVGAGAALVLGGDAFPGIWYRALPVGALLAVAVYGVVGLEQRRQRVAPGWLQALGDASYSMYLWHILILTALGRAVLVRLPADPFVHAAALVFSVLVVIAGSLVAYRVLEKPLTQALRDPSAWVPQRSQAQARHAT